MLKKYLAYISPLEDIYEKEFVNCNVTFITGDLNHSTYKYMIKTDIFQYYYYGSAFEVVELNEKRDLINVHDITKDDYEYFGLNLRSILTLNCCTYDMLASNDITYNLKENKFYTYCKQTVENIYRILPSLEKFRLRVYILNGVVVYIELDTNIDNKGYMLCSGYIVDDKTKLKQSKVVTNNGVSGKEKLNQEEIDKLLTRLIK